MKYLLSLLILFSVKLSAITLPEHAFLNELYSDNAGYGKSISLDIVIDLPKNEKLNEKAPSKVTFYEKNGKDWEEVLKVNLKEKFFLPGMSIKFSEKLKLKNPDSEIAIDSTIYHCSIQNGPCYINNFQKKLTRSKQTKKRLKVTFVASKKK